MNQLLAKWYALTMLKLSKSDARRLMVKHHFRPRPLPEVFTDLGSIQFDPLNPVGRNHDLVLQARVPGYKVDDWQTFAYTERQIYDFWDKKASLVRMADWPKRRIYHDWHKKSWESDVLKPYADAVPIVLAELKARGPMTSAQFEYQVHIGNWEGSWYGPKLTKNILRALWHSGEVVTHSRKHGHHVYDLAENVIPAELLQAPVLSHEASLEFLSLLRHQAIGLVRENASAEVWSFHISAKERKAFIEQLVSEGKLLDIMIDGQKFRSLPETLAKLDQPDLAPRMLFVAPLDQFMWDRAAVKHLFDFDYLWEVYKPEKDRQWGYYVLPVLYGDRLVARLDSRLKEGTWEVLSWVWEAGIQPDTDMLGALEQAVRSFKHYLSADKIKLPRGLDAGTRASWQQGAKG
ncbi:MAG: YcaQ family DNA glycosylase [Trueperaceae bacterium]|nr:YcaQ family DNA glycosylase [Trueperaceae bacterium]